MSAPAGLRSGGKSLWDAITTAHPDLDAPQRAQLEEACRAKDRLDKLDRVLRGDVDSWSEAVYREADDRYELKIDAALSKANETANLMKQLLAALRLPDAATGKRPQFRGARGAQKPSVPGGAKVSSIDRARARSSSA
jgi:predicted  nucleic acid-binding Zn-ribbon protein